MKKTLLAWTVALTFMTGHTAIAAGNLYINGQKSDSIRNINGIDMIAVRKFFEDSGYTLQWFPQENRATIYDPERKITIYAGKKYLYLDSTVFLLSSDAYISDGTLVMPTDAALISLDADIEYKNSDMYLSSKKVHDSSTWQYEILSLTNSERAKYHLAPLVWNASLAAAADSHAQDMADNNYFSHNTPLGADPFDRLKFFGINFISAAENIAAGQPDPQTVVAAWMASEGHRKNILDPRLCEMGASFSRGGTYGIYWAQEFATTK